jgi:hypothetical protein
LPPREPTIGKSAAKILRHRVKKALKQGRGFEKLSARERDFDLVST